MHVCAIATSGKSQTCSLNPGADPPFPPLLPLRCSCAPNCVVQPVLATHHDVAQPDICIFSAADIPAGTELTVDYVREGAWCFV